MSDLRAFLALLQKHQLLLRLSAPADPAGEVSGLMQQLDRRGLAGLFTNVGPFHEAVVYNTLGTREALALALDCAREDTSWVFLERMRERVPTKVVEDGSVHEHVLTDTADLRRLPMITHAVTTKDGIPVATDGPFAESKESLAGYWIVDVSEERAIEIASRVVAFIDEPMEVRQVMDEPPEM